MRGPGPKWRKFAAHYTLLVGVIHWRAMTGAVLMQSLWVLASPRMRFSLRWQATSP